jgi:MFS family permease
MIGEIGLLTFIASTNTFLQTHVDERMRGRVISYYVMAFGGTIPIGSLLIGLLAHFTSAPFTIFVEGLTGIVILLLFIPAFRRSSKRAERNAQRLKKSDVK